MLDIDFDGYRRLLRGREDLMWFQIMYLERNWLLKMEPREFALVQDDATERYRRFRRDRPELYRRLPLFHIASHLGITPTQLSRIRKVEQGQDSGEGARCITGRRRRQGVLHRRPRRSCMEKG